MAFFGSDGLEHQLRQLKAQLSSKDHEITSIRNELKKKGDELNDAKKIKENAEYKLQQEADRALQAENALQQRATELANVRLQYDNLESTLKSANQKLKVGEKENGRLQYDLDVASAQSLKDEAVLLQSKIKDLEAKLKKSEQEKESIQAASSKSRSMKRSATDFFGAALSPAPKRGNRRRSNSLSTNNQVADLEAELESLRATQGPSDAELEKLRTQLTTSKRELDKATNAKLATERASQRELQELKSQLEDANFELEDWRRNGGAGGKVELERVKKDAKAQVDSLLEKVSMLQNQVDAKSRETRDLENQVAALGDLETELERHRETIRSLQAASSSTAESDALQRRIASLEADLSQARSSSSGPALPTDKLTRQLQRENKTLRVEVESLKEDLQQQDDEILRLRGALPLPGSPSFGSKSLQLDSTRVMDLEQELEDVRNEVVDLKATLEKMTEASAGREAEFKAVDRQRGELEAQVAEKQSELASAETRISHLIEAVKVAQEASSVDQSALQTAEKDLKAANEDLLDCQSRLAETTSKHEELAAKLQARSHDDEEIGELRLALTAKSDALSSLESTIETMKGQLDEGLQAVSINAEARDQAQSEVSRLREEISNLMDRVVDVEDRLKDAIAEKKTAVKHVKEKLKEAKCEADSLRLRLEDAQTALEQARASADEMQERYEEAAKAKLDSDTISAELRETIANRSTESEARIRDEALFDNKEEVERLQTALEVEKAEHAKVLESATFVLSQDLREANSRIAVLESELVQISDRSSAAQTKQIGLLQDKIARLRKERDDLRVSLNFVNHEHRFAQQAAKDDLTAAAQELQRAAADLEVKSSLFESLTDDVAQAKRRLVAMLGQATEIVEKENLVDQIAQLEDSLQSAASAKDELVDKVSELEEKMEESIQEHQAQAAESGTLVSELAIARSKASRAESEMNALRRANRELEIRTDRLQAILDARMEKEELISESGENGEGERPGSSMGHNRRRSGLPSPTFGMIESLKVEKADLLGRISRRDDRIQSLMKELKQARVNLQLAEDAAAENSDEKDEATQQAAGVQSTLDNRITELVETQKALESSRTSVQEMSSRISGLEGELSQTKNISTRDQDALRDMVLSLAVHYKAVASNRRRWSNATRALKESDETVDRIRESASIALEGARDRLVHLSSHMTKLENSLATAVDGNVSSKAVIFGLEQSLQQVQDQLTAAQEQNKELEQTLNRVEALEAEVVAKNEDVKARESDITTLLDKLASAEKNRGSSEADAVALTATTAELVLVKSRVGELEMEVQTLLDSLADLEKSRDDMAQTHQQSMKGEALTHAGRMATYESRVAELEAALAAKREEVAAVEGRSDRVQEELADAQARLAEAESKRVSSEEQMEELRHTIENLREETGQMTDVTAPLQADKAVIQALRTTVDTLETASAAASSERVQMSSQVAELEAALASTRARSTQLESDLSTTSARATQLESTLSASTKEVEVVRLRAVAAEEQSQALQNELEKLKEVIAEAHSQLEKMESPAAGAVSADTEGLQERITELEASLSLKVQEVDEADDRVREAYKDKAKLEKKVAKLQRQLATASSPSDTAATTVANTAANAVVTAHASTEMLPPSMPSSFRSAPTSYTPRTTSSAPTPTSRQPLRPTPSKMINVFEPKPSPGGLKRAREEKGDEKPLPAECILLPPANITKDVAMMPKRFSRTAFTPQRGANQVYDPSQQPSSQPRFNIFAGDQ